VESFSNIVGTDRIIKEACNIGDAIAPSFQRLLLELPTDDDRLAVANLMPVPCSEDYDSSRRKDQRLTSNQLIYGHWKTMLFLSSIAKMLEGPSAPITTRINVSSFKLSVSYGYIHHLTCLEHASLISCCLLLGVNTPRSNDKITS
jgi:hypothetical protein